MYTALSLNNNPQSCPSDMWLFALLVYKMSESSTSVSEGSGPVGTWSMTSISTRVSQIQQADDERSLGQRSATFGWRVVQNSILKVGNWSDEAGHGQRIRVPLLVIILIMIMFKGVIDLIKYRQVFGVSESSFRSYLLLHLFHRSVTRQRK